MPTQEVNASVALGAGLNSSPRVSLPVTEATVKLSRHEQADVSTTTAVTDELIPAKDQSAWVIMGPGVSTTAGVLNTVTDNEDGSFALKGFSAQRILRQHEVTGSYQGARADDILDDVLSDVGIGYELSFSDFTEQRLNVAGSGGESTLTGQVAVAPTEGRYSLSPSFTDTPAFEILERITRAAGWYWHVDETNTVCVIDEFRHERTPVHGGIDSGEDVTRPDYAKGFLIHPLKYLKHDGTSPGAMRPPYERVIVWGGSAAESGRTHMVTGNPVWGIATGGRWESGDASFTYRDPILKTPEACEAAALKILKRFQAQQTGGTITIPGIASIRPYDIVEMPNGQNGRPDMGGSKYMVQEVEHRVNNSDGFVSTITVGGLLGADMTATTTSGGGGTTGGSGSDTDTDSDTNTDTNTGGDTDDGGSGGNLIETIANNFPFGPILPGF